MKNINKKEIYKFILRGDLRIVAKFANHEFSKSWEEYVRRRNK